MRFEILSIGLSFFFGIIFVAWLRRFDHYEKEPYLKMLLTTLIGGFVSIFVCSLLYGFVDLTPLNAIKTRSMFGALLIIGPVEEVAKLIGLLAAWRFIRHDINEVNDGLLYMACVALGFSLIENYLYAVTSEDSHYLLYYRLFITSPAHIVMSSFIGMAFYRVKYKRASSRILLYAIVWSSLIHGLYDGFIFSGYMPVSLIILLLAMQQAMILVRVANLRSPFRVNFIRFTQSERQVAPEQPVCPSCHQDHGHRLIRFRNIRIYDCPHCRMMFGKRRQLIRLYRYYIPPLGMDIIRMRRLRLLSKSSYLYTLRKLFFFTSKDQEFGYFNPANFMNMLEVYRRTTVRDFKTRWYSPGRYIAVFD